VANYSFGDQHQAPGFVEPPSRESDGRRKSWIRLIVGAFAILLVGVASGALIGGQTGDDGGTRQAAQAMTVTVTQTVHETEAVETTKRVTETVTATPTTTEDEDSGDTFGDGTWMVGEDIKAGTYRTKGDPDGCYWARLSGTSGEFTDLIANGNPTGPTTVTISATDVAFETRGCAAWRPVS
jgi:cytoskeletal protein RodZ